MTARRPGPFVGPAADAAVARIRLVVEQVAHVKLGHIAERLRDSDGRQPALCPVIVDQHRKPLLLLCDADVFRNLRVG